MVRDYEQARDPLIDLFGLRVLEDTWIDIPAIGRRGGLTWLGDNSLELGQPILPGQGVDVYVSRFGPGIHAVAMQVMDMKATIAHLRASDSTVIEVAPTLSFTHPKDTGGVFIEWFTTELDFDPRFGGEIPPAVDAAIEVSRMAWIGAIVDDPVGAAKAIARLMDTRVTFERPDAGPGAPHAGVDLVDCTLALFRRNKPDVNEQQWGLPHGQPRAHCLALSVDSLELAAAELDRRNVAVVRTDDVGLVISPAATGMVPIVLTDRLLPGDRRGD